MNAIFTLVVILLMNRASYASSDCVITINEKTMVNIARGWGAIEMERKATFYFSKRDKKHWAKEVLIEETYLSPDFGADGGDKNERINRVTKVSVTDPTTNMYRQLKFYKNSSGKMVGQFKFNVPRINSARPEWGNVGVAFIENENVSSNSSSLVAVGGIGVPDERYFDLKANITKACIPSF